MAAGSDNSPCTLNEDPDENVYCIYHFALGIQHELEDERRKGAQ